MIIAIIMICFLTFTVGYLFGKTKRAINRQTKRRTEFMPTDEEYLNFLNYDGSEQI